MVMEPWMGCWCTHASLDGSVCNCLLLLKVLSCVMVSLGTLGNRFLNLPRPLARNACRSDLNLATPQVKRLSASSPSSTLTSSFIALSNSQWPQ